MGGESRCLTTSGSSAEPPEADALDRLEELVHVEHAILEQVAEAAARADQIDGVPALDVLREDEHGRARV